MNEFLKRIESIHRGLGVLEDYQAKYSLTLQHEETDLVEIENDIYGGPQKVAKVVVKPWSKMKVQAEREGVVLNLVSAFRSVDKQTEIIKRKINNGGQIEKILKECAAPGYSEHHSGLALDLTAIGCEPLIENLIKQKLSHGCKKMLIHFRFGCLTPRAINMVLHMSHGTGHLMRVSHISSRLFGHTSALFQCAAQFKR